ncbi:TPM domain-containing protein [Chitinimonas lacunae]|uniref:TPM domain-containing protein n=1 Tax=Chitinimonas lacunae TaxID=1963018 RepID=A0ABV8MUR8_9NEIS
MTRVFKHLCTGWVQRRRTFPPKVLAAIEESVARSERSHGGQICVAIEDCLSPWQLIRGLSARQRAVEVFSQLRVWDTAGNNGVLLYLLLADHAVEIVADRAVVAEVGTTALDAVCHELEAAFRRGDYRNGILHSIEQIGRLLGDHFPPQPGANEVADKPVLL